MKLDSNLAWKDASRNVMRNRDAMAAVAGVFFLLPQLALALFYPQPQPTAGMNEQQIFALVQSYYVSVLPVLIPLLFFQALGTLCLLSLLNHAARPTVGEALRLGLKGVLSYLGAQILLGLGLGFAGGIVIALLSLSGNTVLVIAGMLIVVIAAIGVGVRMSLSGPAVAIEGVLSPVRALTRSWRLTGGNGWRLAAFYALILVAFLVIQAIVGMVIGLPVAMLASAEATQIVAALVSSTLNAVMAVYMIAIVGAVHAQLGDEPRDSDRAAFE